MFRFEKLDVWHRAVDLADNVYCLTSGFPDDERFGLTSQMRRASVSDSSNIVEGSGRASDRDFARLIDMGYGLLMEVVSQAHIAVRRSFCAGSDLSQLNAESEQLAKMPSGLRSSLLRASS